MMAAAPVQPFVFRFGRIGDMVMLTALLRLLHARYGMPCQVAGAGTWASAVLMGNPDVASCWAFPRHSPLPFSRAWLQVVAALRRAAPGPVYVAECCNRQLPRIQRILLMSGIDRRRVLYLDGNPDLLDAHWVDCLLRLGELTPAALRAADYPVPPAGSPWTPRLHIRHGERVERDAWLAARGWLGKQLILLQPGNNRSMGKRRERWRRLNTDDKAWPIERWGELIRRLHERMPRAHILLCGSAPEVAMLEEVRAASGVDAVAVASLALRPTFALAEVAHSMISTDTGPAHAAAAVGLPLVVIFGAMPPRVWAPRSATGAPVMKLGGPPLTSRADQVNVDMVFDAWCQLLEHPAARAAPTSAPEPVELTATSLANARQL
jgi:heptosyltransferase-2/heptosyltransferase-3